MDFNSILIGSEDPDRLAEYYGACSARRRSPTASYSGWQLGSGFLTVGPHSEVKGKSVHPGRIIWNLETADVAGDFERLKAAGAIVVAEPYGFDGDAIGGSIATLADPDDNYFQLMTPMGPPPGA